MEREIFMNPIDPEQPTDQAYLWEAANEEARARALAETDATWEDLVRSNDAHDKAQARQALVILTPSEAARLRRRITERATALENEIGQALGSVQEAMTEAWAIANDPERRRLNDAAPMMLAELQAQRDLLKTLLQVAVFLHSDRQAVIKQLARLEAVIAEAEGRTRNDESGGE